jgi:hypothetical protein
MSAPDLTIPIRDALLAATTVTALLPTYLGAPPIFTRRPVPGDAPYPNIVISKDITLTDQDGVNDYRPNILRDIAVYHSNEDPANYRLVDTIALAVWRLFHRQRPSLTVTGWGVVDIQAAVPVVVEADGSKITGRVVQLMILVARAVD